MSTFRDVAVETLEDDRGWTLGGEADVWPLQSEQQAIRARWLG